MNNHLPGVDIKNHGHPVQAMGIHIYRPGQDILREGEASSCFFVVLSGQVRIIHMGQKIRILKAQDVFGLECVLLNKPSPYSAAAITKSRIASYGSDALDHFLRDHPRITQSILISTLYQLKQTSHNLSGESDSFTIEDVRIRFFRDGDVIIEEGVMGKDFYRLVSTQGGLRVAIGGKEVARIVKPGEFFGVMAGLLNLPRKATVTSIGESAVETYNPSDMDIIIRDYPELALKIMRTLVDRLIDSDDEPGGVYI